jgi:hypothetical protein
MLPYALRQHVIHEAQALLVGVGKPMRDFIGRAMAAFAQSVGVEAADAGTWTKNRTDRVGKNRHL